MIDLSVKVAKDFAVLYRETKKQLERARICNRVVVVASLERQLEAISAAARRANVHRLFMCELEGHL